MALPIPAVQQALKKDGLDGWLLYDFHGSNPIATPADRARVVVEDVHAALVLPGAGRGEPRGSCTRSSVTTRQPAGRKAPSTAARAARGGVEEMLRGMKRVAMEYSPGNAIPYVSRVDAGTVEAVRQLGVDVVSSGDLVQRFEAIWSDEALATHRAASERLYRIKDRAFELVRDRGGTDGLTESKCSRRWSSGSRKRGSSATRRRSWRLRKTPGTRTISRRPTQHRAIATTKSCCSTCGASCRRPARSLLTSPGWDSPGERARNTRGVRRRAGRPRRGVELVKSAAREGRELRGYEVDRARRAVIERAGYGAQFIHRTGHSLGKRCTATACTWTTTKRTTSGG